VSSEKTLSSSTPSSDNSLRNEWKTELFFLSFQDLLLSNDIATIQREYSMRITVKNISLQDQVDLNSSLMSVSSLETTHLPLSSDDYPIMIDSLTRNVVLPAYSSLEIMSMKLQQLLSSLSTAVV
jgi:hypothetical protein